jgi:hypothetical protein
LVRVHLFTRPRAVYCAEYVIIRACVIISQCIAVPCYSAIVLVMYSAAGAPPRGPTCGGAQKRRPGIAQHTVHARSSAITLFRSSQTRLLSHRQDLLSASLDQGYPYLVES